MPQFYKLDGFRIYWRFLEYFADFCTLHTVFYLKKQTLYTNSMQEPKLKETSWDKSFENEIVESWKKEGTYEFNPKENKIVYSIDTPPPYVNAPIHIGHATTYVLMDMFARFKRMSGFNVLFPLGLDRNGLPIEVATEKKFNVSMLQQDMTREKFIGLCKQLLEEHSTKSADSFMKLGISFNSWEIGNKVGDAYFTDMDDYRKITQQTFCDLWKKGLVYKDKRVNNYCPKCRTTIADAEIDYEESDSLFNHVKWKVKETGEEIIIGTTRPELIAACGMVIFNPDDVRYKKLNGKTAISPIYNKEVKIKAHPAAKLEAGTGLVMMCSFGDYTDIRFFRDEKLEPILLIEQDGKMNANAGKELSGLKVKDAREKILVLLKEKSLIAKQEKIRHKTPICERSKTPIEFIAMEEYYLKQMEFVDYIAKIADKTNFYAPKSKQILIDWLNSISMDWAISRRRFYATELPVWYCKSCNETIVPEKIDVYAKPWQEKPKIKKCTNKKCNSTEFIGETRVFDTWFDSSISNLFVLGYGRDDEFFKKHYPCSLRPQGKDIVRTWLYYTLLRNYQLTKKAAFEDAWINQYVVDEHGKKMSKSLGNVIDPQDILAKVGAEPFRFWVAMEGNITDTDFRCSFERIQGAGKFMTKLWNVARFVSMFSLDKKAKTKLTELDKLMLTEMDQLIKNTKAQYEKYDFHNPAVAIRNFAWDAFASNYLELVKSRAYNETNKYSKEEQNAAIFVLHTILKNCLLLLAPIIPVITYRIGKDVYGIDVHSERFPNAVELKKEKIAFALTDLTELNSAIWKFKKDNQMSLKDELSSVVLPEKFKLIESDIQEMHKINKIMYGKELKLSR